MNFEKDREYLRRKHTLDPITGCWLWSGCLFTNGYGCAYSRILKKRLQAHRLSYMAHVGVIPIGSYVCHRCDVKNCINPAHLFAGTPTENAADRDSKCRQARGEKNGLAKLNTEKVLMIRNSSLQHQELAEILGVSEFTIRAVRTRYVWGHVTGDQK